MSYQAQVSWQDEDKALMPKSSLTNAHILRFRLQGLPLAVNISRSAHLTIPFEYANVMIGQRIWNVPMMESFFIDALKYIFYDLQIPEYCLL